MFDSNKPVCLVKKIVTPDGGVLDPRPTPYSFYEIPRRFRTEEYIRQNVDVVVKPVPTQDEQLKYNPIVANSLEVTELKPQPIRVEVNSIIESSEPLKTTVVEQKEETPAVKRINLNTATEKEILARNANNKKILDGIGKPTAVKILEAREEKTFADIADLNERVPLPFSRDWYEYSEFICF